MTNETTTEKETTTWWGFEFSMTELKSIEVRRETPNRLLTADHIWVKKRSKSAIWYRSKREAVDHGLASAKASVSYHESEVLEAAEIIVRFKRMLREIPIAEAPEG